MSRRISIIASAFILLTLTAGADEPHALRELTVNARRPLDQIGTQLTRLDSTAIKENAALSMADILAYNSSLFVKNHGRATLSTVSFRGTSAAHTQVLWNGLQLNSPMSGMTDFSTIPAFMIDRADLKHGATSVSDASGGLGGSVNLSSAPETTPGLHLQYAQGIGSFSTFDEFAKIGYATAAWQVRTRASFSSSPNRYPYINHDKKINIYDSENNIIGQYNPREKNRSGKFADFHVMQEAYYTSRRGNRLSVSLWYSNLKRHLPMLSTDYGSDSEFLNLNREQTLRSSARFVIPGKNRQIRIRAGYEFALRRYVYERDVAPGKTVRMANSRSRQHSVLAGAEGDFFLKPNLMLSVSLTARQNFVRSEDREITSAGSASKFTGYDKARIELSATASARWQPIHRLGLGATIRQDFIADRLTPVIPAIYADFLIHQPSNLTVKVSATRNHRAPSLNDLFFLPGGNPKLRDEIGISYDAGLAFSMPIGSRINLAGSATWFDNHINDWILWLPNPRGYFSPRNVKNVHSYGIETKADLLWRPAADWLLDLSGSLSFTPSVNTGEPMTEGDRSIGHQLPYSPRCSSSVTGRLAWRTWAFTYRWNYYSRRYTMSSNSQTRTGYLPPYFMSNVALEKDFALRKVDLKVKLAVNNLFNEDYMSVLSHPMPGINYELFIIITPQIDVKKSGIKGE